MWGAGPPGRQGVSFMPWSTKGGGPWVPGQRGPWGSGPQSSGPSPPDLEELLRRSQDKLRTVLPGGLGGQGLLLVAPALLVILAVSGFFKVEADERGVVLRFGKSAWDANPGLNYHLPYPIETVVIPKVTRVNRIDVGMRLPDESRPGRGTPSPRPEESL